MAEASKPEKGTRTVHAESEAVEIIQENGRWWVASKRRPELGVEEVTVEYAAWLFHRRPDTFVHHHGLPGGEEFDGLV